MPFTVLPEVCDLVPVNWNVRFLARCSEEIERIDPTGFPPFIHLMDILKNGFVDGCSMTSFNPPSTAQISTTPSIMDFICHLRDDSGGYKKEKLIYDHRSAITYFVLPLGKLLQINENYVMLLWRHERVFSPDDVVTAKIILRLFLSKFNGPSLFSARWLETLGDLTLPILQTAALDAVLERIFVCDRDGKIIYINRKTQEIMQSGGTCRLLSSKLMDLIGNVIHADDIATINETWSLAGIENQPKKCRCRLSIGDQQYHKYSFQFIPLEAQGLTGGWIVLGTDLDLLETVEEFKLRSELKSRFFAQISHEIRTPLACILGTATLLGHTKLDPEQAELLKTISLSSQQLSNLISNVLDMSRIEENKLLIEKLPVHLEKCMQEVLDVFRTDMVRMKLDPILDLDPKLPVCIITDELRLRQILTNLISNAIKFSKPHSVVILSALECESDPTKLQFTVEDEGIGISEIASKALFESFRQAEISTARRFGGSGLGLVITKRLVELLGGSISFKSVLNKGTKFTFTIELGDVSVCSDAAFIGIKNALSRLKKLVDSVATKVILVVLGLSHNRLNTHIKELLSLQGISVQYMKDLEDEKATGVDSVIIEVIDSGPIPRRSTDCVNGSRGLIYVEYEPPLDALTDEEYFVFVRKPIKECTIIQAVHYLISRILRTEWKVSEPALAKINSDAKHFLAERFPLHILVAEDDMLNRVLMVKILQKFGYFDIETAENGVDAIERVEEFDMSPRKIELVFMDMQMPELDGCSASLEIRKRLMNPHIVAMTANAFTEDRDMCLAAGMCDYSSKPVKLEVLENILVTAFECQNGITKCRCSEPKDS